MHLSVFALLALWSFSFVASSDAIATPSTSTLSALRRAPLRRWEEERRPVQVLVSTAAIPSRRKESSSILPVLASAFCAAAIMYPVDLVRALQMSNVNSGQSKLTTLQLLSKFRQAHGLQGFFTQGLAPELVRSTWMRFIKFSLFPLVHVALFRLPESAGSALTKATAAIVAAVPEAISIMPLEIAKISLQLDATNRFRNNAFLALRDVWATKGIKSFGVGYLGVQYRQAMWSAGYFASLGYFVKGVDRAMAMARIAKTPQSTVFSQLISGFLAGVFGAAINTPGDTLRTVMQKSYLTTGETLSVLSLAKNIVEQKGISALYAGFAFKALHLGGGGALMAFFIPFFGRVFSAEDKL